MSATQWVLLLWSGVFLLSAEAVKYLAFENRTAMLVGIGELTLAILTGIAFGLASNRPRT